MTLVTRARQSIRKEFSRMSSTPIQYLKSATASQAANAERLRAVKETVTQVIDDVRARGDEAVREYSEKFDNWSPESFRLSDEDIERIVATVPAQVISDITEVQGRVRAFRAAPTRLAQGLRGGD